MNTPKHYDVIVVGGGTSGCSAAYNCARLGLKTLLVEKNIHLGGTMTSALVTPAMYSSENQVNTDFFDALVEELTALGGQATYMNNPGWFNPELCKVALDRLMVKSNVDLLFDTTLVGVNKSNNQISSLSFLSNSLSVCIGARYVVDATGNCEVGALANCNFLQNENEVQPVSLRFEMAGIDIKTFRDWILNYDNDRNVTTSELINGQIHLSTACTWDKAKNWALKPLFDDAVAKKILEDFDRAYFQLFTIPNMPNSVSFNCPRIYFDKEINPLDNIQVSKALLKGRESIIRLANFCKAYLKGFENAYISNIADALGVRVSRRIKGRYVYTVDDLKSGKIFENAVLVGNYPIDVHSNANDKSVLEHTMQDYYLPIESLISEDFENLFVAGRCLSADFYAQAALRIQPSCFSMGEGVAKYIAKL